MRRHIIPIAAILLLLAVYAPISGAQEGPTEYEIAVIGHINEARRAPLELAASMGMDSDAILENFPELAEILIHGLPPVAPDARLYASASAHTADMLSANYYSEISPDELTWRDRIVEAGYAPEACGEAIGMLGFVNFISPDDASRTLFEKMFKNELDPDWTGNRTILNPDLREVGVSLGAGVFNISGAPWNVYLITCDYGTDASDLLVERLLMNLINDARNHPDEALAALGVDWENTAEFPGADAWMLTMGLPPLARNHRLGRAALKHNQDMLQNKHLGSVSPAGDGPADRIENEGFDALFTTESLGMVIFPDGAAPMEIAVALFEWMVRDELDGAAEDRRIFSTEPTEFSVAYTSTNLEGEDKTLGLAVADFARPAEERTYLVGRIFHDENASLTLDFGEEAAGGRVELRPLHIPDAPTEEAPVDAAGSYQIEIAPFTPHQLVVYDQEDARIYETTIGAAAGANTRYDIALEGLDSPAEGAVSAGRASGSQKSDSWFFIRTGEEMKNVVFAR